MGKGEAGERDVLAAGETRALMPLTREDISDVAGDLAPGATGSVLMIAEDAGYGEEFWIAVLPGDKEDEALLIANEYLKSHVYPGIDPVVVRITRFPLHASAASWRADVAAEEARRLAHNAAIEAERAQTSPPKLPLP